MSDPNRPEDTPYQPGGGGFDPSSWPSSSDPSPPHDQGQHPYGPQEYGQSQEGQSQYGQNQYGQQPYDQNQQAGYGQPAPTPYEQQNPYGQGLEPANPYQNPYGGHPVAPKTNGLAIASLVTALGGLLGFFCGFLGLAAPVGLVLGIIARKQIKENPNAYGGEGLALGGIIAGAVITLIMAIFLMLYIAFFGWSMFNTGDF